MTSMKHIGIAALVVGAIGVRPDVSPMPEGR